VNSKSGRPSKTLDNGACNACSFAIALGPTQLALGLLWSHSIGFQERC
jgi:hypothetical protein